MRFTKLVDYKGKPHFVCKTGTKRIRILEPGRKYEDSFVVPLKKVSNRRPADLDPEEVEDEDLDEINEDAEDLAAFTPQ